MFSTETQQLRTVASHGEGVSFLSLSSPDLKGNYAKNPDGSECEGTTPHRVPCGLPVPPLGRVPPTMHRFIIPCRGSPWILAGNVCCPQRPGLSPWRVETLSFYFTLVSGKRSAGPFGQRGACAFSVLVCCFPSVRAVLFFNGYLAFQKRGKKKEKKTIKKKKVCLVYCEMNCMAYLQYF